MQVDIGRLEQVSRHCRVCQVCYANMVEDEQHFLFECPAYSHTRDRHGSLFEHGDGTIPSLLNTSQHSLLGRYLRKCYFHKRYVQRSPTVNISHCFRAWAQQAWLSYAIK